LWNAGNLERYITQQLYDVLQPIEFQGSKGQATGYLAEILPLLCDVYLRAREAEKVRALQANVAKQAEILVRSLSKVGITAEVDEATGYLNPNTSPDLLISCERTVSNAADCRSTPGLCRSQRDTPSECVS